MKRLLSSIICILYLSTICYISSADSPINPQKESSEIMPLGSTSQVTVEDKTSLTQSKTDIEEKMKNQTSSPETNHTTEYVYTKSGKIKSESVYDADGNKVSSIIYKYSRGEVKNTTYSEFNSSGDEIYTRRDSYSIGEMEGSFETFTEYEYDLNGKKMQSIKKYYHNKVLGTTITTEYNSKEEKISIVHETYINGEWSHTLTENIEYLYNQDGVKTKAVVHEYFTGYSSSLVDYSIITTLTEEPELRSIETIEFDKLGRTFNSEKIYYRLDGNTVGTTVKTFEYYTDGRYLSVQYGYDASGVLVNKQSETFDELGRVTSRYSYGRRGNSSELTLLGSHTIEYLEDGGVRYVSSVFVYNPDGSINHIKTTISVYDDLGRNLERSSYISYDENVLIGELIKKKEYKYDDNNNVIYQKVTGPNRRNNGLGKFVVNIAEYDENGKTIFSGRYYADEMDGELKGEIIWNHEYDEEGRMTFGSWTKYTYRDDGSVVKEFIELYFDENGEIIAGSASTTIDNKVIEESIYDKKYEHILQLMKNPGRREEPSNILLPPWTDLIEGYEATIDGMLFSVFSYGDETGTYYVEIVVEELDITILYSSSGIAIITENDAYIDFGLEKPMSDELEAILDLLKTLKGEGADFLRLKEKLMRSKSALDPEEIKKFLEKITRKDVMLKIDKVLASIGQRYDEKIELLDEILNLYMIFKGKYLGAEEIDLSGATNDASYMSKIIIEVENYVLEVKRGEIEGLSKEEKEKILGDYEALSQKTQGAVSEYVKVIEKTNEIISKDMKEIVGEDDAPVYFSSDKEQIQVIIAMEKS